MTTLKQVHQHINQLVAQDKRDANQVNNYYAQALTVINNSLSAFFNRYADETGLSANDVANTTDTWDLQQFENAVSLLTADLPVNDDLRKRLVAARATAQIDKAHVLSSIATAGLAAATARTQRYGNAAINKSYTDEYKYQRGTQALNKAPKATTDNFNKRIWVFNDASTINVRHTLNKAFKKGVTKQFLRTLLADNHGKPKANNIKFASQAGISFVKNNLKANSISATNSALDSAFKNRSDGQSAKWVTEDDDRVCDICEPMDGNVYDLADAPTPQDDTHVGCRCTLVLCDKDGNLL